MFEMSVMISEVLPVLDGSDQAVLTAFCATKDLILDMYKSAVCHLHVFSKKYCANVLIEYLI